ncbi:hypothetical protein JOD57_001432 [Geodermatophilus bullaregiensis]|uniref:hypothetical protein n=1 Tax=Geodermatophilus bullaregiensis TaxID=1564160 RepID=UPI00195E7C8E|nr:hypothetical protein [Geodermatophilus bullaregiensis]MBM7805595.1 hypothetical protein [Geodermatophilus bullaregiensis]
MPDADRAVSAGPPPAAPDGEPAPPPPAPRRRRARHRARLPGLLVPLVCGAVLTLVLLVGGAALLVALDAPAAAPADVGRITSEPPASGVPASRVPSGTDAPAPPPAPTGATVADWLPDALPGDTDLAASAAVRAELAEQGVPADRLRPAEDAVPGGTPLAVVGPAPAGSRVLARFDRPGDGSELLVVDPAPGEPTAEELDRRRALAEALLANPTTGATGATADALSRAAVDQRLLSLLAGLAARDGVGIASLPVLPGEEGSAAPARRALLSALGGAPVPEDPAATDRLVAWLDAQLPPFAPDEVQVTDEGVLVAFRYVSDPDAVVTAATR